MGNDAPQQDESRYRGYLECIAREAAIKLFGIDAPASNISYSMEAEKTRLSHLREYNPTDQRKLEKQIEHILLMFNPYKPKDGDSLKNNSDFVNKVSTRLRNIMCGKDDPKVKITTCRVVLDTTISALESLRFNTLYATTYCKGIESALKLYEGVYCKPHDTQPNATEKPDAEADNDETLAGVPPPPDYHPKTRKFTPKDLLAATRANRGKMYKVLGKYGASLSLDTKSKLKLSTPITIKESDVSSILKEIFADLTNHQEDDPRAAALKFYDGLKKSE